MECETSEIANNLLFEGKIAQAIIAYQKIIEQMLNKDIGKVRKYAVQGLGNVDDQKGFYENEIPKWYAQQIKQRKLEQNPFEGLALCFSYKSRTFEGRCWYEDKLSKYSDIYQFVLGLANCYYNSNLVNEAVKMYNKAINIDPSCDKAYLGLSYIFLYKLDQKQKARQYALKTVELNPQNMQAKMIVIFTQADQITKMQELEQMLVQKPEFSCKIYHWMGLICYEQGQVDAAVDLFQKSLDIKEYVAPILCLANIAIEKGFYKQSMKFAHWSLQIQASNFDGLIALGCALIYLERYDQAGEWLYSASQVNDKHYLPNYYIGILNYEQGQYEEAIQWFQLAQKCKQSLIGTAGCHQMMGQYKKAARSLQLFIQQRGQRNEVLFELGRIYFVANRFEEALNMFLKVDKNIQDFLTLFMIGCCYLNIGKQLQCQQYLLKSVQIDDSFEQGWLALGHFHLNGQHIEQSIKHFQKVLAINPHNQEALSNLQAAKTFEEEKRQLSGIPQPN